jgi:hypothetical protein
MIRWHEVMALPRVRDRGPRERHGSGLVLGCRAGGTGRQRARPGATSGVASADGPAALAMGRRLAGVHLWFIDGEGKIFIFH